MPTPTIIHVDDGVNDDVNVDDDVDDDVNVDDDVDDDVDVDDDHASSSCAPCRSDAPGMGLEAWRVRLVVSKSTFLSKK